MSKELCVLKHYESKHNKVWWTGRKMDRQQGSDSYASDNLFRQQKIVTKDEEVIWTVPLQWWSIYMSCHLRSLNIMATKYLPKAHNPVDYGESPKKNVSEA